MCSFNARANLIPSSKTNLWMISIVNTGAGGKAGAPEIKYRFSNISHEDIIHSGLHEGSVRVVA